MGLSALFVVVWMLMLGHGSISFAGGFLLVMTACLFLMSVRELLVRYISKRALDEPSNTINTKELTENKDIPSASITESTTRALNNQLIWWASAKNCEDSKVET